MAMLRPNVGDGPPDRVVAAHGHAKALEIFWSIMDALDEEQRSDFDPDGNARVGS